MDPSSTRCRRSSGRQKALLGLMLVVLVLGIGIIGVAANLAARVEAFSHTRTATYWAGVICVALCVLYLPTHYYKFNRSAQPNSKWMFVFWVFMVSFATVCVVFAAMIAVYYSSLISATDSHNCVYYNKNGNLTGPDKCAKQCHIKFSKQAPRKTCCCCRPESSVDEYSGIYVEGIDSCADLFGVVSDSVVALSGINSVAAAFLMLSSILGCVLCCGCCKVEASWSPTNQQIVLVPVEPTTRDKAPLLKGEVVGLDVPPPYAAN